jgi:light-regulated signal transduction histidine kinase (bacteriophytochrome)
MADQVQIIQLFQNMIGNAIKFRGDEPPRIHISAQREGREWVFSIVDNGIGIESEYFERIFVIFQRLHPRAKYSGTGIGLTICKRIIERHGGRIWVESQAGQGSTFYFSLPAVPDEHA